MGSIRIVADSSSISAGTTTQLHAISTTSGNSTSTDVTSTVTWTSSNGAVATVSTSGMLTGSAPGSATITATLQKVAGSLPVTIATAAITGLTVGPQNAAIYTNGTQQYTATLAYSDKSTSNANAFTTWSVTPAATAKISSSGLLTALAPGGYTVTAVAASLSAVAAGTVSTPGLTSIAVTPANSNVAGGKTLQFVATGTYADKSTQNLSSQVTWTSSNTSVLTIASTGLATATGNNATTVTVTAQLGAISGQTSVSVTPASALTALYTVPSSSSIATGSAEQHSALALYADGSQQDVTSSVVWSVFSTTPAVQKNGARARSSRSHGKAAANDTGVVSVNPTGLDSAGAPGTAMLQATLGTMQAQSVVIVTPATVTQLHITAGDALFPVGSTEAVQLIGVFSDGSTQDLSLTANWQSSNPSVATIDSTGLATGVSAGPITFSASFGGLNATSTGMQVLPRTLISTVVKAIYPEVVPGESEQLQLLGTYSDGTTHDLTSLAFWQSSAPAIVRVSSTGLAYGLTTGNAQVAGTVFGKTALTNLNSESSPLLGMQVLPLNPSFALGTSVQFDALANFNGSPALVNGPSIWVSNDPTVLTIDGTGRAKSGKVGSTTVTASFLGVTGVSTTVQVTNARLARLHITPATAQIAATTSQPFTANGVFDDGSTQDITGDVTWTSSDPTVATINADGIAFGVKAGTVQVNAWFEGQTVSVRLTVTNAQLLSVVVTPDNAELPIGVTRQYALTANFSDGTTQDFTNDLSTVWTAPTPTIAAVILDGEVIGSSAGVGQVQAQRGAFSAATAVNVTNATFTSMSLTPSSISLRQGQQQQLTCIGTFSDGYTQNLVEGAVFSTNNRKVIDVGEFALAFATGVGTTQITSTYRGQQATTAVQVLSGVLSSVTITPPNPSLQAGATQQLTAIGTYTDGSTGDVSSSVVWTSSNPAVLNVDENGLLTAYATGATASVTVTGQSGGVSQSVTVTVYPGGVTRPTPTLTSLTVLPTSSRIATNTAVQFVATGGYSDGSSQDLTSSVTWSSANQGLATISASGVATGVAPGMVTIQAQSGSVQSQAVLIVSSATLTSVAVTPSSPSFAAGAAQQFTLTGSFSDGSTQNLNASAAWLSSAPAVATISTTGLATAVAAGTTQLSATALGQSATDTVTITSAILVSLAITPPNPSFADGTAQQFTIIGTYSDGSTHDVTGSSTFTTSNPSVLSVTSGGLAQGVTPGSAQITASFGGQTATTQSVTVTPATLVSIAITPNSPSFAKGTTLPFLATGTFSDGSTQNLSSEVVWTSSTPAVLTINRNGNASSGNPGSATVTATFNGVTATTGTIQVTSATMTGLVIAPTTAQIAKGTTQQFTATGTFSDGSTQNISSLATWSSSNGAVASIDAMGLATGTGAGSAQVSASYQGFSAFTSSFQVTPATLVSIAFTPASPSVAAGTTAQVTVTGTFSDGSTQNLSSSSTYSSSNPSSVTVNSSGLITGVAAGTSIVTVQAGGVTNTFSATVTNASLSSITITPATPANFAKGTTQQFTATGNYSDGSTQNLSSTATWSSSNAAAVTVNSTGLATGTGVGSAQLTASYQSQTATTPSFQVTPATVASIAVTPVNQSLTAGSTQQYTATATYTDASTGDVSSTVTWTSSAPAIATINSSGLATAVSAGSTTIGAQLNSLSNSTTLTVTALVGPPATLTSITVTPTSSRIASTTAVQFTATGNYSDGSTQNLSSSTTWTSSSPAVGTISASGVATGAQPGTTSIQAQSGSIQSNQATLIVSAATLSSVAVSPSNPSFADGAPQQLTLTGSFSDGSMQNLNASATWSSAAPAVATVSTAGVATGVAAGTSLITASALSHNATTTVTITPATLVSVAITPSSPSFAAGTTQQFIVIGTYSDGTTHDVTSSATFSSSNAAVVSISTTGVARGLAPGSVQITASFGGQSATTQSVTVTPATLVSVAITPNSPSFANGTTQPFTAIGTFSDGTTENLTSQILWSSSSPAVLTIDQNGNATSGGTGSATVSATLNGITGTSGTVQVTSATLVSLAIAPTTAQIAKGTTQPFTATGTYSDGSTQNLSSAVTWSSSNGAVASINASGLATGTGAGSAQITASYQGQSVSTSSFQVTPATLVSIAFTPASPTVAAGTTAQVTVTGTFSDGSTQNLSSSATYSSSNPSAVTVSSSGVITGVGPGSSTVTVQVDGVTNTFNATVTSATLTSITITPTTPANFARGTTQQFTATGTYSDSSTQNLSSTVTWSSSNSAAVTINSNGLATAAGIGSAQITAAYQSQTATTPSFQVTPATVTSLSVNPINDTISSGSTQQFSATATYTDGTSNDVTSTVTWSSSAAAVATINSSGLATAVAPGSTTIAAQLNSASNSTPLTVTAVGPTRTLTSITLAPTSSRIASGTGVQFVATGNYSDGTTQNLSSSVTWSSSNLNVATISSSGVATGGEQGTVSVEAQSGSLTSNQATLIVSAATLVSVAVSPSGPSFAMGAGQQLTLTGSFSDGSTQNLNASATWTSLAPGVASVSSTGLVTGVATGVAQISASFAGDSATTTVMITPATLVSVAITPSSPAFANGTSQQFTVIATYSDGSTHDVTNTATFVSTNTAVLSVSTNGVARGLTTGSAQITASFGGQSSTTSSVTVTAATLVSVAITPNSPSFANGTTQAFTATGTFSDGSTQNLTSQILWSSSNAAVITIDQNGNATSGGVGSATITATLNGVTGTSGTVQVTSAVLTSLAIAPTTGQIAKGTTQQFTATGTYSDGTTQNLSSTVAWSSSNGAVASINASGLATGTGTGSAQITASYQSYSASTSSFQVTPATLVSIAFTPASPSVAAGTSTQVTVTGTFSDSSTQNLTNSSTYSSSNHAAVTVNNTGLITGVAPGSATLTVQVDGVTNTFTATVTNATLTSITITPTNPANFAKGTTQQFTATGNYSDSSTQNLSSTVTWSSSSTAVVTINSNGLATGTGIGSAQITAAYQAQTATTPTFQVTAATVASIAVTPANPSVVVSNTQQFTATATYTDASTADVSATATWTSGTPSVATINSTGLATGVGAGSTTITAQLNSVSNSTTLMVTAAPAVTLTSITITPSSATVASGNTQQFAATGNYSDGSTQNLTTLVTWQSSVPAVATINNVGLATSVSGGNTQIQASYQGRSATVTMTVSAATLVSLAVTPQSVSIADGTTQQYTATGTLSDGSTQNLTTSVTWSSSSTTVATINASGLSSTHAVGTSTITATAGSTTGTSSLTVTTATVQSLQIWPATISLPVGSAQQLLVTATFSDGSSQNVTTSVAYATSNAAVTTVSTAGNLTAVGTGSATVTVTLNSVQATLPVTISSAVLSSLAITPASPSLAAGTSKQLTATGTFTDGSTQNLTNSVTWSSSASSTVSVSSTGNLVAAHSGTAVITATSGSTSATDNVTVTAAVITSIAVSPAAATLAVGQSQQFAATATLSDGTQQTITSSANWSVSVPAKATVSNASGSNGLLTATAAGSLNVTATQNSISGSAPVTVTAATLSSVAITPNPASLPVATTLALTATGTFSDGGSAVVNSSTTWTSSNGSVATVDSTGLVHGLTAGLATITATDGAQTATVLTTVSAATLNSISITPSAPSLPLGTHTQLTATGHYSDGSTSDITSEVQWVSSAPSVATVSSTGLISTLTSGSSTLTATMGSVSHQASLTVTTAVLQSIAVEASQSTFALGLSLQLTAIGTYSDSSTQNLTSSVTWSSQTPSIGVVSSAGLATGVTTGTFNAKATLNGITGSLSITVSNAVLQSIVVTPANQTIISIGGRQQYTATGHFSDGSTQNMTTLVLWSLTPAIGLGTINQQGAFSSTALGAGTVVATYGSVSGSTGVLIVAI